jgi:hypothetical protein
MEVLWLAILLYSVGLAIVLHLRPALMFHANGTWKEFGYQRSTESRYTIFPFWLFAVVWAFVSYAVASAVAWSWMSASAAAGAATAVSRNRNWLSSEDEESDAMMMTPIGSAPQYADEEEDMDDEGAMEQPVSQMMERRPRGRPRGSTKKPRQGYYVLASSPGSPETSGLQRYIYYGTTPPPAGLNEGSTR